MPIIALDFSKLEIYLGMILQGLFTGIGVGLSAGILYLFKNRINHHYEKIKGVIKKNENSKI